MALETQPPLTDLAQRGKPCKPWAEWCRLRLHNYLDAGIYTPRKDESNDLSTSYVGPLPSCTYLDDQLGEFLRLADIDHMHEPNSYSCLVFWGGPKVEEVCKCGNPPTLLDQLEAAVILVERANRLGEYAHYTETESAPYMAAFLRGIGK